MLRIKGLTFGMLRSNFGSNVVIPSTLRRGQRSPIGTLHLNTHRRTGDENLGGADAISPENVFLPNGFESSIILFKFGQRGPGARSPGKFSKFEHLKRDFLRSKPHNFSKILRTKTYTLAHKLPEYLSRNCPKVIISLKVGGAAAPPAPPPASYAYVNTFSAG